MPRLLRVHFASIGHPDARLAPLHLDLRAREGVGTGVDSVLWLRNGGGKSTILNLFYSLFRPDRREFLGASAEGKARHLEDYVKGDDLAFVVTEWDVDPPSGEELFARGPTRRRVVGQVLAWRDRQRSSDPSKLRRRFFSFIADGDATFDSLPIDGLAPPARSWEAFRDWLDLLRQQRPELEAYWEDTPRKWNEHLEKIGLDPELFRYQLKMNAREGSADEAFRFRTTDEFVRFYLEVAFDATEADRVSSNLEGFRDKLARRPELLVERDFLVDARQEIATLGEATAAADLATARHVASLRDAASVHRAIAHRRDAQRAEERAAHDEAHGARASAQQAGNDAARLGRWAKGLDRLALDLDVAEAAAAHAAAQQDHTDAQRAEQAAVAAELRDQRRDTERARDAKADALAVAERGREPLRAAAAQRGATLRARLAEAERAAHERVTTLRADTERANDERQRVQAEREALSARSARLDAERSQLDAWLGERDRERERLRQEGWIDLREEAADAATRWAAAAEAGRDDAARFAMLAREHLAAAEAARAEAHALAVHISEARAELRAESARLAGARGEQARLVASPAVLRVEGTDAPDLDAPGLVDRLHTAAEGTRRQLLVSAVDGAEDERAWQALDRTGRLPPTADVERALTVLRQTNTPAWGGTEYLAENLPNAADREAMVRRAPHVWHGLIVPDEATLRRAEALLATHDARAAVTVAIAHLDLAADAGHVVLPGHAAHWDHRAAASLRDDLDDRRRARERRREELAAHEHDARDAAAKVTAWRDQWGDGGLAMASSDHDQRVAATERRDHQRALAEATAAEQQTLATAAAGRRQEAEATAARADTIALRLRDFLDRFEAHIAAKRDRRADVEAQRAEAVLQRESLDRALSVADDAHLRARDLAADAERHRAALLAERDQVDLAEGPPTDDDLATARAAWHAARDRWREVVSDNRLKWELDALEERLQAELQQEREASRGIEPLVEAIPPGAGGAAHADAKPRRAAASERLIAARLAEDRAKAQLHAGGPRRRDADDLPSDAPPPTTAADARTRAQRCRDDLEGANQRATAERHRGEHAEARERAAEAEATRCDHRLKRLLDALGEAPPDGESAELGERTIDALVDARLTALREAVAVRDQARRAAEARAEALRSVALSQRHEAYRGHLKVRLSAPAAELVTSATPLLGDLEDRLDVVRTAIGEIDEDRRFVLGQLDKVAMDGVQLLRAAEGASKLPAGLGAWEGEPFLRIRAEVAGNQPERQARLEPLLDRLVAKGIIPAGRDLVDQAVRELAGQRVDATLLKPDAMLRRDRLPVTEMQSFSRGQQLTVAILLYCTMARLRAQQRGRGHRPDGGVLLLDNPVGTCSSVPLLELQRLVARQMRVQLVYTTGVNDPNAVATFPNTVRLRNAHRARATGDLHVTLDAEPSPGVEAVRVVAV